MVTLTVQGENISDVFEKLAGFGITRGIAEQARGLASSEDKLVFDAPEPPEPTADPEKIETAEAPKPKKTRGAKKETPVLEFKKPEEAPPAALDPTPAVLKPLTADEVKERVIAFAEAYSTHAKDENAGSVALGKILKPFGVARVGELKPEQYAEFLEMVEMVLPAAAK